MRDDRTIRALVAQGKERDAVEFCISWGPDKSNAHFGAWMDALDKVTDIKGLTSTHRCATGGTRSRGSSPRPAARWSRQQR